MQTPSELLTTYWGHTRFRPFQEEIISQLLEGRDVLALLATGSGKSLCYQVPALCRPGICLVVSPLIALMKDQVDALQDKGIPAGALYTGMSWKESEAMLQSALRGQVRLLYVSPERLETRAFLEYLPGLDIRLVAIDEAHCISEWGHDFRPAYRRISALREELPGVPFLALTATATEAVRRDIADQLQMKNPAVLVGSLLRQGLSLDVVSTRDKRQDLFNILSENKGTALVYCRHRKSTEDLAAYLRNRGLNAGAYHGGMDPDVRQRQQEAWISSQASVLVCTSAFGMGIDKPDVRAVIHADVPDSLESYYQEAGRAGRDGNPSRACLLYGPADIGALRDLPRQRFPEESVIRDTYRDLAHYLQIPSGSGEMEWYDFSLDTFLSRFPRGAASTLYAMKALEQEELLMYADRVQLPPSCQFTVEKGELNRAVEDNPVLAPLVDALLRKYPGILHYPARISERLLSRLTRQSTDELGSLLRQMDRAGIVHYTAAVNSAQVRLLQPRVRMEDLHIDYARILARKSAYEARVGKMIDFITQTTVCRSQYLGNYFGAPETPPCGECDVCRARR